MWVVQEGPVCALTRRLRLDLWPTALVIRDLCLFRKEVAVETGAGLTESRLQGRAPGVGLCK